MPLECHRGPSLACPFPCLRRLSPRTFSRCHFGNRSPAGEPSGASHCEPIAPLVIATDQITMAWGSGWLRVRQQPIAVVITHENGLSPSVSHAHPSPSGSSNQTSRSVTPWSRRSGPIWGLAKAFGIGRKPLFESSDGRTPGVASPMDAKDDLSNPLHPDGEYHVSVPSALHRRLSWGRCRAVSFTHQRDGWPCNDTERAVESLELSRETLRFNFGIS